MECTQEQKDCISRTTALLKLVPPKRPRHCEHVKTNGEFCGSPSMRGRNYCYFHLTHIGRRLRAERRHARVQANSLENAVVPLELPPFEDANSIQIALMQVVDALLHNRIDAKHARLVLYALQTASCNLARGADFEHGSEATVAGSYDDFEDDFELGEDVPELKTDAAEEAQKDEQHAETMKMEQIAEICARIEARKEEAGQKGEMTTEEDGSESFHCDPVDGLLCSIWGPLRQAYDPGTSSEAQGRERDVASQRLELSPSIVGAPIVLQAAGRKRARAADGRKVAA